MDKPVEVLKRGWLVKSPPEKQMNRKFMPANWKRRYFVLQEAVSNIPGNSAKLLYYKDERCKQLKGEIDLEHCEEVLSSLDSPLYTYLFSLRTVQGRKNEARTYYLAADSMYDMNSWVESLCSVLGLKENASPTVAVAQTGPTGPATANRYSDEPHVAIPPPIQPITVRNSNIPPPGPRGAGEDYLPLETCFSGHNNNNVNDVIAQSRGSVDKVEYDHPRSHSIDSTDSMYRTPPSKPTPIPSSYDSTYNVPRKRDQPEYINQSGNDSEDDIYNYPNPQHQSVYNVPSSGASTLKREPSERDSNSSNGSKHSHKSTDDSGLGGSNDNITQGMRGLRTSHSSRSSEIYNVPPSSARVVDTNKRLLDTVPPPARVPKPTENNRNQYVNLEENKDSSKHPFPKPAQSVEYDIPPSSRKRNDVEMLKLHPPAPCGKITAHQYVNAGTGVVGVTSPMHVPVSPPHGTKSQASGGSTQTRTAVRPPYMPMNKASGGSGLVGAAPGSAEDQDSYLPMTNSPQDSYLPMDGPEDSYLPMQGGGNSPQDSYLPMSRQDSSFYPMNDRRLQRGSVSPDDSYLPMGSDRASTDSTYQVLPSGVHPVSPGNDYDNRLSRCAEYSGGSLNRPVTSTYAERDSIYSCHPSNKPVGTPPMAPRMGGGGSVKGLDAYVPSGGRPAVVARQHAQVPNRSLDAYASPPSMRESEIYETTPSNRPVPNRRQDQVPELPPSIAHRPSFNAERSRSFKRQVDIPALPIAKQSEGDSDSSEDEDDSEDQLSTCSSSHNLSMDSLPAKPAHPQTQAVKRSLNSTPPTPKKPGEIQYLDLGLDEPSGTSGKERSPVFPRTPTNNSNASPTEYHDIDFVKTQALIATRRDVESKRKSSEKSMDE